jgi:5-methylcytosine-specific restriction endonuclease McrA
MAGLRRLTYKYPPRTETLRAARIERGLYKCQNCKLVFKKKLINVDHIEPVIPAGGFPLTEDGKDDWTTIIERLFCSQDNMQCLCVPCHKSKTLVNTLERRHYRHAKKLSKN